VGIDDNLFVLGGDSILSIRVTSKAREQGINLSIQQTFQHQTIRKIAEAIGADQAHPEPAEDEPFSMVSDEDRRRLPEDLEDAYPLAMLQTGMIFHHSLDPDAAIYHNIGSYHLRAPLDIEVMHAAIERVIKRRPILRTSFDLASFSEPLQLVHRAAPVPLQVEDLRELSAVEQEERIKHWVEAEKRKSFDWARQPLLRFHIHRRSHDTFQFNMTDHHAILDGWSVASLLTELFLTYFSLLAGDPITPPAENTFRRFVALERKALSSADGRDYWKRKLSDSSVTKLPRLPASYRSIDGESGDGRSTHAVDVIIPSEVSAGLGRTAQSEHLPIKSVLLAAHLKVMSLIGGQTDVVTGVVIHGRPEGAGGESALGLFLNTVPFRLALRPESWGEMARRTFETEREMMPYRHYQMAQIQRDLGGQSLFETVFNYTNFHVFQNLEKLDRLTVLDSSLFAQTNLPFWADFSLDVASSAVRLALTANADSLSAEQLRSVGGYYARALESMAFDPHQDHASCGLLSQAERRQVLAEWNETGVEYRTPGSIGRAFEAQVEQTPDAVAVVCESEQLTYSGLNQRANRVARRLLSLGVRPETRVAVCMTRSTELVAGSLCCRRRWGATVDRSIAELLEREASRLHGSLFLRLRRLSAADTQRKGRSPFAEQDRTIDRSNNRGDRGGEGGPWLGGAPRSS
jgi:hypothetical protein